MKTLIWGGWVIDPANGINEQRNLLVEDGKILWTGKEMPEAHRTVDATGLTVTPGFIDIHTHEDPLEDGRIAQCIFPMALRQGVTTVVGGNCGGNVWDPVEYLQQVDRQGTAVHVALFAGHEYFRTAAGAEDIYGPATEAQKQAMETGIRKALDGGCVGVSFGLRYVPGTDRDEFFRAAACCRGTGKLLASHVRDDADRVFAAIDEFCEAGVEYGLPVQISHIGSMAGFGQMSGVLEQVRGYRDRGLDIALDCYPYFAFSTRLGATTYDPGWLERYHCGYEVLEFCEGPLRGQRATAETFRVTRETFPDCITVCHVMREEDIRTAFQSPLVMPASDGLMNNGQGHPRAAGTFVRFLAEFARKGTLSLYDAVEKMTCQPARRLGLSAKGHLGVGADADIAVFDYSQVRDQATFQCPDLPPVGIRYVFVDGQLALENGKILRDNCGKAIRK